MEDNNINAEELLNAASEAPRGADLEDYNPLESIPTLAVGKEIKAGQVINGYFEMTERIVSAKFKNSQERDPASGLPVQYRQIFRLTNGQKLAIWTTGELSLVCEKLQPGELISITYKGKGVNAQGRDQHFFEYKKMKPTSH